VLTFAFPVILFAVIAVILYLRLFARPHRRVPPRRVAVASATAATPDPGAAVGRAAAGGQTATGNVSGGDRESAEAGDSAHGTTEGTEASE
jgi:hypothetical protein